MPLATGQRIGAYEIISAIGAGGMGEVYRARDSKLKREVAIKVLPADVANDRERLARFQREAESLAALNHPHIAHVYGIEDNALVMELVKGEDLSQRIARGPIPIDETLSIAKQIAEAMEAAHDAGIIHRDLKPANIKVRDDGTVKVLDFGLAKAAERLEGDGSSRRQDELANSPTITSPAMTMRGVILGTAAYMAPEQAKGKAVDKRADIWAFGCVLYEMLTGKRAFEGEDATDTIAALITKEPDWAKLPAGTPAGLRRLVHLCLVKDRKHRLRDIGDAHHELSDTAAPIAPAIQTRPSSRLGFAIATVAVIAAAVLAYPALQHWREPARVPRPMRFTIDAPEQTQRVLSQQVSPDGQSLLFSTVSVVGRRGVWIRRFDEMTAMAIPEVLAPSGGAFWSPDGRSFAYPSRTGLAVYDLETKSSREVARFSTTLSGMTRFFGTWSAESGIVYGVGPNIYRVAEGEAPTAITFNDLPKNADNRFPLFLPDGRHFLFLSGDFGASTLRVGSVEGGTSKALFRAESQAAYTEPAPGRGHLMFVRDGNLMAQPFSLTAMQAQGEPYIVVPDVPVFTAEFVGTGRGLFSVSRDGLLVCVSEPNPALPRLAWFDRAGKEVGTIGEPAFYFGPRIAPDGRHVAVSQLDPRTRLGDIYVIDERGASQRLTFDPANDLQPVWMPRGDAVIYGSQRNGKSQLYRKLADGSGTEELLYESEYSLSPDDVSADGKLVVFRETHPITQNDLWLLPLDGSGKARPIMNTSIDEPRARFSPDGKLMTYIGGESTNVPSAISFPDLKSKWQIGPLGSLPQWRRDGKEIYYQSGPRASLVARPVLSTIPLRLGEVIPLFEPPSGPRGSFYHVSADGKRFLFAVDPPQPDLSRYHVAIDWMKPQ
jgi:serine/threonine protein kinase/Tol biopolymer transport system component